MRKFLFFAIALVASAMVFTGCNKDKNDASAIKGIKFCCDLDRGQTPVREYLYFGYSDDFEWGMEIYEDQERTKMLSASGDYGTYVLNEEKQYIDMTFAGSAKTVKLSIIKKAVIKKNIFFINGKTPSNPSLIIV